MPPGSRAPALVQALRYVRAPLGLLIELQRRHGDVFTMRFPFWGELVYVADPVLVKRLFTGSTQLADGGPACISCHAIAGAGSLGGGQVGPDLTAAYEKYGGAAGVGPMLAALPFPTMTPIYSDHPLTAQEQANLAAFLESTTGKSPAGDSPWVLVGVGAGVAAAFLLLAFAIWPRRRLSVRRGIAPTPTLTRRR